MTKRVQGFFDDAFDLRVVRYVSFLQLIGAPAP